VFPVNHVNERFLLDASKKNIYHRFFLMSDAEMDFLLEFWSELEAETVELRADDIMKDVESIHGHIYDNDKESDVPKYVANDMLQGLYEPSHTDTKVRCPREKGCYINKVKGLGGRGPCKGADAIGAMNGHECKCGLRWKENNLRERMRRQKAGFVDTLSVTILK